MFTGIVQGIATIEDVTAEIERREGISGLEEKANRSDKREDAHAD